MLEARSISRRAGESWLFRDQSLVVPRGERIALAGPSGAGKTVLLRALALLDPLDAGTVLLDGRPVAAGEAPAFRCRVAYLHQTPALADGTVEDNLRLPFTLTAHRHQKFDRRRAVGMLAELGKEESFLGRRRGELSGGEAQIVALVRLLQLSPALLLLDEPTAALDPDAAELARELLVGWQRGDAGDRAYVWVTHDARLAGRVAERRLRLENGSLAEGRQEVPA